MPTDKAPALSTGDTGMKDKCLHKKITVQRLEVGYRDKQKNQQS